MDTLITSLSSEIIQKVWIFNILLCMIDWLIHPSIRPRTSMVFLDSNEGNYLNTSWVLMSSFYDVHTISGYDWLCKNTVLYHLRWYLPFLQGCTFFRVEGWRENKKDCFLTSKGGNEEKKRSFHINIILSLSA